MPESPLLTHLRPTPLKRFLFGSAYYPEHWDADVRAGDPKLFADAGWNVVRMGEFAWNLFEPEEGTFDFSLFDETIEQFAAVGIKTIFCTPTAAPPRWLTFHYPEVLRVDAKGVPLAHGSRQHASHLSPVFREHSRRITSALAEHFASNPNVIGWQTDNEFHCHFSEDHSLAAEQEFANFLCERYEGDIQRLNRSWGTVFWAQTYRDFNEIPTPRPNAPTHLNPAHVLDYRRFLDWGTTRFQREQIEILRAATDRWWVTHNGCFLNIDFRGPFTSDLDFLSFDSYPFFHSDYLLRPIHHAYKLDTIRSYSGNFVVMEHQSGPGGQGDYFLDNPEPGEMRRMAWTSVARGADGILFFRERNCRFGAEEYWCGILDHDNVPRRRYQEAAQVGKEFARLGDSILGTTVRVDVAVAGIDYVAESGHSIVSMGLPGPKDSASTVHEVFYREGFAVGAIHPSDCLDGLHLYFVPHIALFDPEWIPNLERFVREGGWLVIGARSGTKDRNNNVVAETIPGVLRSLTGVSVEEYGRQNRPDLRPIGLRIGETELSSELWYEIIRADPETEVCGVWTSRHIKGAPAVTMRRLEKGGVFYVGTYFTPSVVKALLPLFEKVGALPPRISPLPGVEVVERVGDSRRFRFVINHREETATFPIPVELPHELLENEKTDSGIEITLESNGVAIFTDFSSLPQN